MTIREMSVADIKAVLLPKVFANPSLIGEFGSVATDEDSLASVFTLMEQSPVIALGVKLAEIGAVLRGADPRRITRKAAWLKRMFALDDEVRAGYEAAGRRLEPLLQEAERAADRVRGTVRILEQAVASTEARLRSVQAHHLAAVDYLSEHPEAGVPGAGAFEYDRPRDRLQRRLLHLKTLEATLALSLPQLQLARAQAIEQLDRFGQFSSVLLPVWQQHVVSLMAAQHADREVVAAATKAHEAVMRSLAGSAKTMARRDPP
ncbi:protein KlaA [Aquabacterium sp. A7-Y]|uniref:protein KlaA n=1 Tax=Aquabacterium sp. A7-Y TaxID=1349605 RepID=UPI00223CBA11|nr:protein KlaA [Aquabacterium sp. A7-Y]MCW7541256.1 protein KlaA [Aquabacterium sp. A7-Y]